MSRLLGLYASALMAALDSLGVSIEHEEEADGHRMLCLRYGYGEHEIALPTSHDLLCSPGFVAAAAAELGIAPTDLYDKVRQMQPVARLN